MRRLGLFDLLVAQRRFVYLAVALLSAAGIWTATRLPSAIYPELVFPRITIVAEGSSLGARQVTFTVARPIEEAVSVVPGIQRVVSRSIRGAAELNLYFAPSTDMIYALQQVQARVNQVEGQLPAGLDIEVERLTPSVFPILSYNVMGGDPATLYDIARYQIRPILSRVPGVGRVDVQGTDIREIEVVADPTRIAALGLSYDALASAIRDATGVAAVGRVARDYQQYLIVADDQAHSVDDIANVVLPNGLRVRDIASVRPGTEDHTRVVAGDGRPVATLNITRQLGGNTVTIADSVAALVRQIAPTLPPGVRLEPVYDQASLVRDAVTSVRDAMLIGAALAVVVLLLFLGHARITAVSATSIPLTLAITVFIMGLIGQTFNLMTLGAMAIAIGLVIDDAVVVTENIARHLRLTPDRTVAIRDALQELLWPVTTSTITTVVVFLPLGLLQGVVGQFFKALSITLTIAVLVSLVLAVTIIPLLSEQFVTAEDTDDEATGGAGAEERVPGRDIGRGQPRRPMMGVLARIGRAVNALGVRYERALGSVLHHVRWVLIAAVALIVGGVALQHVVGTGFLPEMDEGAFVLDYLSPGGTALAETDRQVRIVERILAQTPGVAATSRRTGAELGLFATEQNRGDIVARLAPRSARSRDIFEIIDDVRGRVAAAVPRLHVEFVQILSDVINDLAGAARPVEVKLYGEQLDPLEAYGRRLGQRLSSVPGLADVYNGVSEPSPELDVRVSGVEAARLGLTPAQVTTQVSGALLGTDAGDVQVTDRLIGVRVRAPDSVRYDPDRLATLPVVPSAGSATAPLGALATIVPTTSRASFTRENQQQMISVTGDVDNRSLGSVMADVQRVLAANPPPPGIRVELGGQYAGQQEAFHALLLVLGLAAVSVIGVMLIQFESFIEPLIVVLAAPLSFVGALALLWVTGTPLNVSSFMGLILLVGLVVKNGIILLDFTRYFMRQEGVPLEQGIREAARVRLRPILMTTLCTLFGLLPLALGLGAGSELQRPLALAVIGGLALSTPITLFVVPTLVVAIRGREWCLARAAEAPVAPVPAPAVRAV